MAVSREQMKVTWGKVIANAWEDDAYKARLLDDPRTVLVEAGVDVPAGVTITVSEQSPDQVHLTLPPKPDDEDMELDDARLEAAAGGDWHWCCW